MEKKLRISPDCVYVIVMALVIASWFSASSVQVKTKNDAIPMTIKKALPVDLQVLGVKPEALIPCVDCNIEHINDILMSDDVFQVKEGMQLKISGWVLDRKSMRIPDYVIALLSSAEGIQYSFVSPVGFARPDVVKYFNLSSKLTNSGYVIDLSDAKISSGIYSIKLILLFEDYNYICDNGRKIMIN